MRRPTPLPFAGLGRSGRGVARPSRASGGLVGRIGAGRALTEPVRAGDSLGSSEASGRGRNGDGDGGSGAVKHGGYAPGGGHDPLGRSIRHGLGADQIYGPPPPTPPADASHRHRPTGRTPRQGTWPPTRTRVTPPTSQCTYRCVVLPDGALGGYKRTPVGLNAPTGAWCSLTGLRDATCQGLTPVSMHLQVRGAP